MCGFGGVPNIGQTQTAFRLEIFEWILNEFQIRGDNSKSATKFQGFK